MPRSYPAELHVKAVGMVAKTRHLYSSDSAAIAAAAAHFGVSASAVRGWVRRQHDAARFARLVSVNDGLRQEMLAAARALVAAAA